ncbi:MAG: biotin/lipoate A/B protein ligase family protein [Coriobacteriia bacterium]|nr:biotin/lipoate A/B protein ligase family protein [Coriobacteriia bacterium]
MASSWRLLIEDAPMSGVRNMAVDRAILAARARDTAPATLRIYSWVRPTVTLGRFQDAAGVDLGLCDTCGIDVVRRFTGGRGVLHDNEITYSVVASTADGVPRGVAASYRFLCQGLVSAYHHLGMDAQLTRRNVGTASSAACYLHATPADLSLGARKLSGSAQVWQGSAVLQHGSFTISRDAGLEAEVFRLSQDASRLLVESTATLSGRGAGVPERAEIVSAVVRGFAEGLGITLTPGVLSAEEEHLAHMFAREIEGEPTAKIPNVSVDLELE